MSRGTGPFNQLHLLILAILLVGGLLSSLAQTDRATTDKPILSSKQQPSEQRSSSGGYDPLEELEEERAYEATAEAAEELRRYELFQEQRAARGISDCTCTSNAYDCVDFATGNDAQACYQHCLVVTGLDVHWLDDDADGSACDWSPRE
jgi:hypothetical protein